MLESMRAVQGTWFGKAVMGLIFLLIIVGLSFFGFADLFRGGGATWVANIGGQEVSVENFRQAYQTNLQQMQQRLRRPLTNVQARQMGVDQQTLSRLVTDALLDNQARKLGLAISDPQIAKVITEDPTFAGTNGQFDHSRFTELLRENGLTEKTFVQDQRNTYLRQEVVDGVAGAMTVPKAASEALHRFGSETRSLDTITLQPSLVGDVPAPDDATLEKFFDERKQQFVAPEYRTVTVLAISPTLVAKPDAVTDDEVQKAYEAAPEDRFGAPERRILQQIVFPTQTEAEAAALRVASGTPFASIAAERNVSGKDLELGTVSKNQIFDPAVAQAAFALEADGTSAPIKGAFGTVLVHVAAIQPGSRKPLDAVASELRKEIAEQPARTRDALRALRDAIEDARASGKTLAEAAKAAGVETRQATGIDATGRDKAGAVVTLPDSDQVLRAAFASDVGVDNEVIQGRTGDLVWFEISNIEAGRQRTFAEVKPAVEAAWRAGEVAKRLTAMAEDAAKAVQSGKTLEEVAAGLGNATVRHVGDLRRAGTAGVAAAVALKAFDTPLGGAAEAAGDEGDRVVFKILDSVVPPLDPDAPQSKQADERYRALLADDVLAAYLTRVQESIGVKINPDALRNAVGGTS